PIPALVRCEGRNRGTGISLSVRIAAGWRGVPRDREGNLAPWPAAGGGSLTAGGAAGGSGVPPHSWHRLDLAAGGAPEPYAPGGGGGILSVWCGGRGVPARRDAVLLGDLVLDLDVQARMGAAVV